MVSSSKEVSSSSEKVSSSTNTAPSTKVTFCNGLVILPKLSFEKFPAFLNFPQEVQDMIWEATMRRRLVEIRFAKVGNQLYQHTNYTHDFIADFPVILHVCQKSRRIGLKNYELVFFHNGCVAPVYFNFNLDCLYPRAGCSTKQLDFLSQNMDYDDMDRIRFLAMYNEHLERTRSLYNWFAFPYSFPRLKTLMVLFKSFVDPKQIDAKALPARKNSVVRMPNCNETTPDGRRSPAFVKYDREILKEKVRAALNPPRHYCQRHAQKGQSRRTHLVWHTIMKNDKRFHARYAAQKIKGYRRKLKIAARNLRYSDGTRYKWHLPDLRLSGFCEYGLEFQKTGLAYKGKFFRKFDDQGNLIKKGYWAGILTCNLKDQI